MCVGCGGCVFKCPKQCISMTINAMGQLSPVVDYEACIECKLCESNCPVYHGSQMMGSDKQNDIVGNYISCFMGYDESLRPTSASGGFVTGVLKYLLDRNLINFAVCLRNTKIGSQFYQYEFVDNSEDLVACSRSAYYPVEMSKMLRHIKDNEGKYAIVVLPCQAKIIRTLQERDPILKRRITFLLGLVCGGVPGSAMIDYIDHSVGVIPDDIQQISFRDKSSCDFNSNCTITLRDIECNKHKSNFENGAFGFSYLNKLFHYIGCNVCDDIFAEYADAAFMDAWLPEYNEEIFGRSICVIRNEHLQNAVKDYFTSNPNCKEVSIEIPIRAQNTVGLIQRKKKQSYFKRKLYRRFGYITPDPGIHTLTKKEKLKFFIRSVQEYMIQNKSSKEWKRYKVGKIDFSSYDSRIHKYIKRVKRI